MNLPTGDLALLGAELRSKASSNHDLGRETSKLMELYGCLLADSSARVE